MDIFSLTKVNTFALTLSTALLTTAYALAAPTHLSAEFIERLEMQRYAYPQEKIHVVTDRNVYCGGDTVWLRVFVADAATHQQTTMSKYAYAELINPFGKVQDRVKLMERDGVYAGYLPINTDIYEGDYTLAAYTAYAENPGEEYFFKKPLKLLSLHGKDYNVETRFSPSGESTVKGVFKLNKADGHDNKSRKVSYTMPDGEYIERPSNQDFKKDFNLNKGECTVLVKYGDYGKFIPIDSHMTDTMDIAFYPEGGWLIEGVPCKVAFKATDSNGRGMDVAGTIYEKDGERVAEFKTTHNGMGSVSFIPEKGKTYMAEYLDADLEKHTAELGTPKSGAAALRYSGTASKSTFSVAGGAGKTYELVVACRGMGLFSIPISAGEFFSIDRAELPTGLHQALLVSPSDSVVVSERLFFIGAERPSKMEKSAILSPDSTAIKLTAGIANPADCSVLILKSDADTDGNSPDILTQMLLQSELRGRIENPSYYFDRPNKETDQNLDLLMMVNGWSRYNIPEVLLGNIEEPTIPLEIGQEISGQVRSRWKNKPLEGVMVNAIVPKKNFGTFADTDQEGFFHLNGFDFPEDTPFILKAMNEKGGNETNYDIFEDRFPVIEKLKESVLVNNNVLSEILNGNKWKILDDLNVTARSLSGAEIYGYDTYGALASYSCTSNDFKTRGISSIEQAMRVFPGISYMMGYLKWRNKYIAYYLDGHLFQPNPSSGFGKGPMLSEINSLIPFEEIERIDFIRPEDAIVIGRTYGGGALMIITKQGNKTGWQKQLELKDHLPLGYQRYKEYASPMLAAEADDYELQNQQTLLWLPSVKFDEKGTTIDLNSPVRSDYRIIIEGIAENGDIIYERH